MDDCFAVIPTDEIDEFLIFINSINSDIQFTVEKEIDKCISFLDIMITKDNDGKLNFQVYRKSTSNDRYLDYNSCNPASHKITTAKALLRRAFTICSDEDSKIQELDKVRKDLLNNGYPRTLLDKCLREITQPKLPPLDSTENQKYIVAPYLKGVTEKTAKILKKHNMKMFSTNKNSLRNHLVKLKDKREIIENKNAIYSISCKEDNCNARYIGETGRTVGIRMDEHRRSVSKKEERSQIYVHKKETQGHDFDIDNVKIIAKENNMKPRRFVEACFTKFTSNNINRSIDIPNCYNTILKKHINA